MANEELINSITDKINGYINNFNSAVEEILSTSTEENLPQTAVSVFNTYRKTAVDMQTSSISSLLEFDSGAVTIDDMNNIIRLFEEGNKALNFNYLTLFATNQEDDENVSEEQD